MNYPIATRPINNAPGGLYSNKLKYGSFGIAQGFGEGYETQARFLGRRPIYFPV